jgi:hypothetical protein
MLPNRPVGVIVASVAVFVVGLAMAWSQARDLRYEHDPRALRAAWCFITAGLAALAGAIGVWKRMSWARVALLIWIVGTVAGFLEREVTPLDMGVLMPIAFIKGPEVILAWYLDRWIRRAAAHDADGGRTVPDSPRRSPHVADSATALRDAGVRHRRLPARHLQSREGPVRRDRVGVDGRLAHRVHGGPASIDGEVTAGEGERRAG